MSYVNLPDSLASILQDLERRLAAVERTNQTGFQIGVTDPGGILRVEAGNLPLRGISPAQYGLRLTDGSGNLILDGLGLAAIMSVLAQQSFGGSTISTVGGATYASVSGSAVSINPARSVKILVLADLTLRTTGTGVYSYGEIRVDGAYVGGAVPLFDKGAAAYVNAFMAVVKTVTGGAHGIDVGVSTDNNTTTANIYGGDVLVFQLGG